MTRVDYSTNLRQPNKDIGGDLDLDIERIKELLSGIRNNSKSGGVKIPHSELMKKSSHYAHITRAEEEELLGSAIPLYTDIWPKRIYHDKYFNPEMYKRYYQHFPKIGETHNGVIDFGAGDQPSPVSTITIERFVEATLHRTRNATVNRDIPVIQADIVRSLPIDIDLKFDLGIASHIFEHLLPDELEVALVNILGMVKRLYLEVPLESWERKFGFYEHFYFIRRVGKKLLFLVKTKEDWLANIPNIIAAQKMRNGDLPDRLPYYSYMRNNYHKLYAGQFIDRNSIDNIEIVKRRGAICNRADLYRVYQDYGLYDTNPKLELEHRSWIE